MTFRGTFLGITMFPVCQRVFRATFHNLTNMIRNFDDVWRAELTFWFERHKEKERRRVELLNQGIKAEYGYWNDKVPPKVPEYVEYCNDTPTVNVPGLIYMLEYGYKQVNAIFESGESPVNLTIKEGNFYRETSDNAFKLPENYVLIDLYGTKVKRMADGRFKPLFLGLF